MNIFAKKYIQSLIVYDKIDVIKTKTGECVYIVTYDLSKNKESRILNLLITTNLCCAYRNWFMNFIFIEKNVKERDDYLFFLFHEIGHIVHHDLYRSNARKYKKQIKADIILVNNDIEKNADSYAFEKTGIKASIEKLFEYVVWAQEYIIQIFQPENYEIIKSADRLTELHEKLYNEIKKYNDIVSTRFA